MACYSVSKEIMLHLEAVSQYQLSLEGKDDVNVGQSNSQLWENINKAEKILDKQLGNHKLSNKYKTVELQSDDSENKISVSSDLLTINAKVNWLCLSPDSIKNYQKCYNINKENIFYKIINYLKRGFKKWIELSGLRI